MPTIAPGITLEQKTVTVAADDASVNAEITTQGDDGWMVASITLSGADVIILFTRTTAAS